MPEEKERSLVSIYWMMLRGRSEELEYAEWWCGCALLFAAPFLIVIAASFVWGVWWLCSHLRWVS